jgi:hypothetical protein
MKVELSKSSAQKSFSGFSGLITQINNSPISVTVDATNWSTYKSGVFNNCKASFNHAVLVGAVGCNWKITNSWEPAGEKVDSSASLPETLRPLRICRSGTHLPSAHTSSIIYYSAHLINQLTKF